jgi:hypothetical protein
MHRPETARTQACLRIHYERDAKKSQEDSLKMVGDRAFAAISSCENHKNRLLPVDFQMVLD